MTIENPMSIVCVLMYVDRFIFKSFKKIFVKEYGVHKDFFL